MKLQCKICKHEVSIGENVIAGSVQMITHVQTRHPKVGMNALMALGGYVSTYFFEPVATQPLEPTEDMWKETKRTLLQGFREWAKTGVK